MCLKRMRYTYETAMSLLNLLRSIPSGKNCVAASGFSVICLPGRVYNENPSFKTLHSARANMSKKLKVVCVEQVVNMKES